jgi:hypothetical protein
MSREQVAIHQPRRQRPDGEQCMPIFAGKASPARNSPEFHGWHTVLALELRLFARM